MDVWVCATGAGTRVWSVVVKKQSVYGRRLKFTLMDKCRNIDMNKLIEILDYLIDNIFIRAGNKVFRKTIGIPMGTDCAPLLANLFLFYYEYHYMKKLIRDNQCLAKKFNYRLRYIDDL